MTLANLFSAQWWTAVGVALLIWAILSDLFKKLVYAALARVSTYYSKRRDDVKATLERHASAAAEVPALHSMWAHGETRNRLRAIYYLLLAICSLSMYGVAKVLSTPTNLKYAPWGVTVTSDQIVAFVMYISAVALAMRASHSWGRAANSGKTLARADQIIFERSLEALRPSPERVGEVADRVEVIP